MPYDTREKRQAYEIRRRAAKAARNKARYVADPAYAARCIEAGKQTYARNKAHGQLQCLFGAPDLD